MGCASSKLDDLPAVALCRERCSFLDEAIHQRFLFAEAHVGYISSLKTIGSSLHDFIEQDYHSGAGVPRSPSLNLPPHRKGDPLPVGPSDSSPKKVHHNRSNSAGSHLEFNTESDDDEDDDDETDSISYLHLHHHDGSDNSSPLHSESGGGGQMGYFNSEFVDHHNSQLQQQDLFFGGGGGGGGGGGFMHMNFMKKQTTPSVVYEQRPVSSETVYFGDSSTSSYYYPPASTNDSYFGNPNYGGGGGGGGMMSAYYEYPPPYGSSLPPPVQAAASSSKPAPPPPSPPRASAWEFLNPFESYEKFYPQYTPSRDSKELREEEGIPDLEDEEYQNELVKEVHVDQKFVDTSGGGGGGNYSKSIMVEDGDGKVSGGEAQASHYEARPSASLDNERMEFDVHVVDKKVVNNDRGEDRSSGFKGRPRDPSQVAVEIKIQFERASECGNEIAEMLEVGTVPYHRKYASKLLQGVPASLSGVSSLPSTSGSAGEASSSVDKYVEIDEDLARRSKNLSSTLHKLYLWEKKLYNEVKIEEKMRVAHERKCRKLKRLDERGAEGQKVHATQTVIRSLSTKIRMAIQVVDKISITINKIRDEELWPQLNQLIEGLNRMWKNMFACHHSQCQAVKEARNLGPLGSGKKRSDSDLEATLQLERELLAWTSSFSSWISAQKGYVRALNNWLVKCLLYEPEETPDGVAPFSPGRLGAPPVFVICNQWAQAMDRISEREVIQAMRDFAMSVFQLWEQDKAEMQQRMMANKDLERKARNLDREDQKIHKEIQALEKKIVVVAGDDNNLSLTGNVVYHSDTKNNSLQGCLQRIFEAMEQFVAESMKAYEELLQRAEEEKRAREHDRVS